MTVRAITGANWGDEGKGKITDALAGAADIVIRFQGGANAGHTIVSPYGKFVLHLLPSGAFNPHCVNVIGNGVALDIPELKHEIDTLVAGGVPTPNILISDRVQVLMPYHRLFDTWEEARLSDKQFGSTKSGIAPFYSDKYAKVGFQLCELYDDEAELQAKIASVLHLKNLVIDAVYHQPPIDPDELFRTLVEWREWTRPYVCNTLEYLHRALKEGKKIMLEGQLGSLKDPDHGIYPFTTSSHTVAGFATIGAGIPPYAIKEVTTVVKAYSSAVGAGAFVSEIFGEEADRLRAVGGDGGEFGATTGRPRRMGWFDCVATRYGLMVQGSTEVAFTVVDALSYLDEIPVCVAYDVDGEVSNIFPTTPKLNRAKPVLERLPGWKRDIRGIKKYADLPENCRKYIEFIEERISVPIKLVSNGPAREDLMDKP
jgi:adenylosuccinate synthase